jgi:hypothetical protein
MTSGLNVNIFWWTLAGGFFGIVATFAATLLGFLLIFFGYYAVVLGGVVGLLFGAWKGFIERPNDRKESRVNTSDRPFY